MKRTLMCTFLMAAASVLGAQTGGPKTFGSAEEARDALIEAAGRGLDDVKAIFGPNSAGTLHTGDPVEDKKLLSAFLERVKNKMQIQADEWDPNRATLLVGEDEWPFPVPLVKKNGRWSYDVQEGKSEIRRRIIGRNELDAIDICQGYVEAQDRYAQADRDGKGILHYARKIFSSEGKKDGLYWPGEDSPVAAGFAKASSEGYTRSSGAPQPYHGYFYRILTAQGPDAEEGARDYLVKDMMIGGFALVAWPAEYGVSGFKTFIVNQDGVVYEKDFGAQTSAVAKAMKTFNPDKTWNISPVTPGQ
jgi:hypothetical protein